MKKEKILKIYLEKVHLAEKYNKHYHDKDKPIVSDRTFDLLKKDIIETENKHKFLKNERSPTRTVGFKPSKNFQKVKHKIPMLSLGNAFNEEDLKSFEKKNNQFFKFKRRKFNRI